MLRGLYTAASGMIAQQRKHDTVTNNISNMQTAGYKAGSISNRSFPEMLINLTRSNDGKGTPTQIGRINTGVLAEENIPIFKQGDLQATDRLGDFAILSDIAVAGMTFDANGKNVGEGGEVTYQPQAFFTVMGQDGEVAYTRDGKFSVNALGEWVTSTGYRVLGVNGEPIVFTDPEMEAKVNDRGLFINPDTGDFLVGDDGAPLQMLISRIDNPNLLVKNGDGTFRLDAAADEPVAVVAGDNIRLMQGYIERSNVDPATAMIELMAVSRAYQANQQVIQYYDRSLERAVNEIARI